MDFRQFMRFCAHAKILEPGVVDRPRLYRIFFAAVGQRLPEASEGRKAHLRMGPDEWVVALVRVAHRKYNQTNASVSQRLELLTERHLAHCQYPERGSPLFQITRSARIQEVIDRYRGLLNDAFNGYCEGATVPPQLHEGEWREMLMECHLVDATFTHSAVQQVFQRAQDMDDVEDCSQTMILPEFLDGLVLVAMFKHPAPYIPLDERLDQFLVVNFLVPLRAKFQWVSPELDEAAARYNITTLR